MNIKTILSAMLLITLNLFALNGFAASSVWKISKDGKYFYLGGTIHILSPDDHPLPKEFAKAYKDAEQIYFETDIQEAQSPAFQQKFMKAITYANGQTLKSTLKEDSYLRLKAFMDSRKMPIASFENFKPMGVALMITVLEYQRLGMLPEYGVESHFQRLALKDGKPMHSLETVDQQLKFIMSMDDMEPNEMIDYSIEDLESSLELVEFMKKHWRNGTVEAFTKHPSIVEMRKEFPDMYEALLTTRNNNWMEKLVKLNDNAATEFVLVGSMHLNDKDGLLNLLKKQGYTIEQL